MVPSMPAFTVILRLPSVRSGLPETNQPTTDSAQSHLSRSLYQSIPSQHPTPSPHTPAPRSQSSAAPPRRRHCALHHLAHQRDGRHMCRESRRASRPRAATTGSPRHPTPPKSPAYVMQGPVCLPATSYLLTCTILAYPTLPS